MINFLTKHIRTDIRYILKGGGVMMVGQVGVSAIAFVSSVAFANMLAKTEFGVYQYILATIELILVFSLTGMGRAMTVSVAKGFEGSYKEAVKKSLWYGTPAMLLGLFVGAYYIYNSNIVLGLGIGIGTAAMLAVTVFKYYLPFLNGKKLFTESSSYNFINILVSSSSVVTTLFFTGNILYILGIFLISNFITSYVLHGLSKKKINNKDTDPTLVKRALHLSGQNLIGRLTSQIDRILLFQFTGPVALAEYWLAQSIQRQFSHLFKSTKAIVIPKLSTQSVSKLRKTLMRKVLLLFVIIIPFTFLYVLAVPYIFKFLFPEYTESIIFAQFFGILFLFLPFKVLADIFVGHGMNNILYRITIFSSILRLVTTITLVPFFGIWGIIVSSTIDQLVHTTIVVKYFYKLK